MSDMVITLRFSDLSDPLLQLVFSYLDSYDQKVFLVLNTQFFRLGEDLSIVRINVEDWIVVNSRRLANIRNGYDRLDLIFQASIEVFRRQIIQSYQKRIEEEGREATHPPHSPPSDERLYDIFFELWPFNYLRELRTDLLNILTLLERKKLQRLQILSISLDTEEDDDVNLIKLFDLLHRQDRCSYLQLKRLEIGNFNINDNDDALRPHLPFFDIFTGLRSLRLTGFRIPENPGLGFQSLKDLELVSCLLECDVCCFDGVERLKLEDCEGCYELPVWKTTRHVHISSQLQEGDSFYTASVLNLWTDRYYKDTIHLDQYENARSFSLEISKNDKKDLPSFLMPEKLSDKLKELRIERLTINSLPSNSLRLVKFSGANLSDVFLQSLSNIQNVHLCDCEEISLDSLGSGIKSITVEECQIIASSSLGCCEKVSIINCRINHTLQLSDVKELKLQDCHFNITKESNGFVVLCISNCQKLEVLTMDFEYLQSHEIIVSEFPSLKKVVVLRDMDWKMDVLATSNFHVCLMPEVSSDPVYVTYLSDR